MSGAQSREPPDKILIDAVLDGLKAGVVFLVDSENDTKDVALLAKKTEHLASGALIQQLGEIAARKFFVKSENPWILRTSFGGWVFFYPIEEIAPDMSWEGLGQPSIVYWPDANGSYASVPWALWATQRIVGNVWRPTAPPADHPRNIWERLRDPF